MQYCQCGSALIGGICICIFILVFEVQDGNHVEDMYTRGGGGMEEVVIIVYITSS